MTVACHPSRRPRVTDRLYQAHSVKEFPMLAADCLDEMRTSWLPHLTDGGLSRLIDLLESASPLLVHGCFTKTVPMGCLATHAAWNHPRTAHLTLDAGITWLHRVAGLNPATSAVLREWDRRGVQDLELRAGLLRELHAEQQARACRPKTVRPLRQLVEA
jgi:hypothetical protein